MKKILLVLTLLFATTACQAGRIDQLDMKEVRDFILNLSRSRSTPSAYIVLDGQVYSVFQFQEYIYMSKGTVHSRIRSASVTPLMRNPSWYSDYLEISSDITDKEPKTYYINEEGLLIIEYR